MKYLVLVFQVVSFVVGRCGIVVDHCGSLWDRCGSLWVVVDRCGSLWDRCGIVVDRCGLLWIVVDRYGSLWIVVDHCGSFRVLVTAADYVRSRQTLRSRSRYGQKPWTSPHLHRMGRERDSQAPK